MKHSKALWHNSRCSENSFLMYLDGTVEMKGGDVPQMPVQLGFSETKWAIEITGMCKEFLVSSWPKKKKEKKNQNDNFYTAVLHCWLSRQ